MVVRLRSSSISLILFGLIYRSFELVALLLSFQSVVYPDSTTALKQVRTLIIREDSSLKIVAKTQR